MRRGMAQVPVLLKKFYLLEREETFARDCLDMKRAALVAKKKDQVGALLSRAGFQLYAGQDIYYLPSGEKVLAQQVTFNEANGITPRGVSKKIQDVMRLGYETLPEEKRKAGGARAVAEAASDAANLDRSPPICQTTNSSIPPYSAARTTRAPPRLA